MRSARLSASARRIRKAFAALGFALLAACVSFPPAPARSVGPRFDDGALVSFDGARLPARQWTPGAEASPRAVVIALHGMNDHAGMFEETAAFWAEDYGVLTIAYDQRGFGAAPARGRWAGAASMTADLAAAVAAARADYPNAPLYLVGHSMGAAVVLSAFVRDDGDDPEDALEEAYRAEIRRGVDGVVLAAPAVWGGGELPLVYRLALNAAAGLAPGKTLTGERAARQASDNIEALRAMARDPLMIRETRIDAVLGIVRLMDAAWRGAKDLAPETAPPRALMLMGEKDEIIPVDAQEKLSARLEARLGERFEASSYPDGWHLLFRDLQRRTVWTRVGEWMMGDGAGEIAQKSATVADQ